MTIAHCGSVWNIDHCYPVSKIDLFYKTDRCKSTHCINLKPMHFNGNSVEKAEIDNGLYLMQEMKAKYFIKLNV